MVMSERDSIASGSIADYIKGGRIIPIFVLSVSQGKVQAIVDGDKKEHSFPIKLLDGVVDCSHVLNGDDSIKRDKLREISKIREGLAREIELEILHEFVVDDMREYSGYELASLYFGDEIDGNHVGAIHRALHSEQIFFSDNGIRYLPNSEEKMEKIIREREAKLERKKKI